MAQNRAFDRLEKWLPIGISALSLAVSGISLWVSNQARAISEAANRANLNITSASIERARFGQGRIDVKIRNTGHTVGTHITILPVVTVTQQGEGHVRQIAQDPFNTKAVDDIGPDRETSFPVVFDIPDTLPNQSLLIVNLTMDLLFIPEGTKSRLAGKASCWSLISSQEHEPLPVGPMACNGPELFQAANGAVNQERRPVKRNENGIEKVEKQIKK